MQKNILVMDEDVHLCEVLKTIMEHLGFPVVDTAKNGKEAIKKAKNKKYAVVIADLSIDWQKENGALSLVALPEFKTTKIIVFSGWVKDKEMLEPKKFGFAAALSKPADLETLKETINKVLKN
jgi:DNA-binding NarL/FixJ family response regulator